MMVEQRTPSKTAAWVLLEAPGGDRRATAVP